MTMKGSTTATWKYFLDLILLLREFRSFPVPRTDWLPPLMYPRRDCPPDFLQIIQASQQTVIQTTLLQTTGTSSPTRLQSNPGQVEMNRVIIKVKKLITCVSEIRPFSTFYFVPDEGASTASCLCSFVIYLFNCSRYIPPQCS